MPRTLSIDVPHNFRPRGYQFPFFTAMQRGVKRACLVWHRRAGKDKSVLNLTIGEMFKRVGSYYHCFPEYGQGRKILWDGIDKEGFKVLSHFPPEIIKHKNSSEMKIETINGSIWQIIGADNYDSLVGPNPVGLVMSEWGVSDKYPKAWDYFRPILAENGGWAVFPYTPRGRNHGFNLYQMAMGNPDWFCQLLTVEDTHAISPADIQAERDSGMGEEMIQQEFYCSFIASTENIVIPFEFIQSSIGRQVSFEQSPRLAGLDVARFGNDRTCIVIRQGGEIMLIEVWQGQNLAFTTGKVAAMHREGLFDMVAVDAIGMGAGVADYLQAVGVPTIAVNVSETPSESSRFAMLRDELWWLAREWFQSRTCSISKALHPKTMTALIADIQDIHYDYLPSGKIKIETKASMKERLGFSPDVGDALCLTFHPSLRMAITKSYKKQGGVDMVDWSKRGEKVHKVADHKYEVRVS